MKKSLQEFIAFILVLAIGFGGGYFYCQYEQKPETETVNNSGSGLPGEVTKRVVTTREVKAKLTEIEQLATYMGEYTITKTGGEIRHWGIDILFTNNEISITCNGIVKVGYDINDIAVIVDSEAQKISVVLPEPTVLDNYVIWDSVQCIEKNNVLNPIEFSQYQDLIQEIEDEGLEKVEQEGIYKTAKTNLMRIIVNFLAEFDGYTVEFL